MDWLAFVPIILVFTLLLFSVSSRITLILSMIFTGFIAWIEFDTSLITIGVATCIGILKSLEILIIIFGALLLLEVTKKTNILQNLSHLITHISGNLGVQTILVGFVFGSLIEGIAGFGTPAIIVAPILVQIGLSTRNAVLVALIFNSSPVSYGAVGTPIFALSEIVPFSLSQLPRLVSIGHLIPMLLLPIIVLIFLSLQESRFSRQDVLEALPFAGLVGLLMGSISLSTAWIIGPELPSIVAPLLTLFLILTVFRPILPYTPLHTLPKLSNITLTLSPYIIITLLLMCSRIPGLGIQKLLQSFKVSWNMIGGLPVEYSFIPLMNPGLFPFIPFSLAFIWFMHVPAKRDILKTSLVRLLPALPTLIPTVILVQIYLLSELNEIGMIDAIAQVFNGLDTRATIILSPLLGVLGSFLTGSSTVSNLLMTPLQLTNASRTMVDPVFFLALQAIGSAVGNMISIGNIIAVGTVLTLQDSEGKILTKNLPLVIGYCFVTLGSLLFWSWITS